MNKRTALENERRQLNEDCDSIEAQLHKAITKYHTTGVPADQTWYFGAQSALKKKRRRIQDLNVEIAQLRREENMTQALGFERMFIDAARQALTKSQFDDLCTTALNRLAQAKNVSAAEGI